MISEIPIGESEPAEIETPAVENPETLPEIETPSEQSPITEGPQSPPPPPRPPDRIPKRRPGRPKKEKPESPAPKAKPESPAPKAKPESKKPAPVMPAPAFSIDDLSNAELVAALVNRRRANERTMRAELYKSWVM